MMHMSHALLFSVIVGGLMFTVLACLTQEARDVSR